MYIDKPCQAMLGNTDNESKAIQVGNFNLKDSQMQTIPVVKKNMQIQSEVPLKPLQTCNCNFRSESDASCISNIHSESLNYVEMLEKKLGMSIIL